MLPGPKLTLPKSEPAFTGPVVGFPGSDIAFTGPEGLRRAAESKFIIVFSASLSPLSPPLRLCGFFRSGGGGVGGRGVGPDYGPLRGSRVRRDCYDERMAKTTPAFLGVDLGGTNIQCGLVSQAGKGEPEVVARAGTRTRADKGSDAVIGRIVKIVDKVLDKAGVKPDDVGGLGIGAPGAIDIHKGVVLPGTQSSMGQLPAGQAVEG